MFKKLWQGLSKTREKLTSGLKGLFSGGRKLDDAFIEELEEVLYSSDMGTTALKIIERVQKAYKKKEIESPEQVFEFLKQDLTERMGGGDTTLNRAPSGPTVVLVAGVNGSGKTTSIAKLTKHFKDQGLSVMLAAGDTFRAAAVEQLTIWSERLGVEIIKAATGSDPAAVAFDAVEAAATQNVDILLVDTAGRLHTQKNLMAELEKIRNVLSKKIPGAPHEVLLVLDGTTGQNAIQQAKLFSEAIQVTGLVLSKLDGTAKGGAVIGIRDQIDIPVKFIGVGEQPDDLQVFEPASFVNALLEV